MSGEGEDEESESRPSHKNSVENRIALQRAQDLERELEIIMREKSSMEEIQSTQNEQIAELNRLISTERLQHQVGVGEGVYLCTGSVLVLCGVVH